ncbi:MAG: amidohydrolase family protein, partial [Acidobacteriota bacterium]|nr:amidohydrolase family protein [Acidobacteriota bacterium]
MDVPIVDIHVHIQPWDMLKPDVQATMMAQRRPDELALLQELLRDPRALLRWMDTQGIQAMALINYSSPDVMGFTDEVNAFVTKFCTAAPDRLIAVGSLHPRFTPNPADFVRTWIDRGLRAFKLHPPHQLVYPNDYLHGSRSLEALYAICQEASV